MLFRTRIAALCAVLIFTVTVTGCSGSDGPTPDVAQSYLSAKLGKIWNLSLSSCQGDTNQQTCVAAYNRAFMTAQFYEELTMQFQKTPSGWNVTGYDVIKTNPL